MNTLEVLATAAVALFIIRRTDAIYWYSRMLLKRDAKYEAARKDGTHWLDYLNTKHDNFWTELLACPFCLCAWLSTATAAYLGQYYAAALHYIAIMAIYLVLAGVQAALRKL